MNGPDALLALADAAVSGNDKSADKFIGRGPPAIAQSAAEEEEDLLLCLADNLAPVAHQQGCQRSPIGQKNISSTLTQAAGGGQLVQHPARHSAAKLPPAAPEAIERGQGHMLQHRHPSFSTSRQQHPQQGVKRQAYECQHYVEKLTGLKIKLPRVSGVALKERYRHIQYVPVGEAKGFTPSDGQSWVVIAVLVAKSIGSTSQGAPYSRWRLADLAGNEAWVALFGEAHKEHYSEAEGSVIAFYQPRFTSKGPGGSSSSSSGGLAVSQSNQVELLASSAGWGFCRGKTKTGARCHNAVDTTISHYCQYHALQQAKTLRAGVLGAAAAGPAAGHRQQAAAATATATPAVPAQSNGMVFDARKGTWSSLSSSTIGQQCSSSNSSSRLPAGTGSQLRSSSSSPGVLPPVTVPLGDAAAAAAVARVEARVAAERQRRDQALQAEVKETLRRKLLQQKLHGKQQQKQQQQQQERCDLPPAAKAAVASSSPMAVASKANKRSQAAFNLAAIVAAVDVPAGEQQQQRPWPVIGPTTSRKTGVDARTAGAAAAAAGAGSNQELDLEEQLNDGVATAAAAAADPVAGAAGPDGTSSQLHSAPSAMSILINMDSRHGSTSSTPCPAAAAAAGWHNSKSSSRTSVVAKQQNQQQKLRSDLGLGPKGAKLAKSSTAAGKSRGSASAAAPGAAHVSRIGAFHPPPPAAAAAAQGGVPQPAAATGPRGASSSSSSSFKDAFSRVLQRQDINKPDAKLLSAASDQQHVAAFSKLLDQYEQKDQLAQQLEGITKLLVTAFECRTCNALTEKRRASCSGHDVVAVQVVKRWWLCEACQWKLTTLREVLPSKRCPKCRDPGKLFQPTSAYRGPKSLPPLTAQAGAGQPLASRDAMLPRGEEHAKFLNSMQS